MKWDEDKTVPGPLSPLFKESSPQKTSSPLEQSLFPVWQSVATQDENHTLETHIHIKVELFRMDRETEEPLPTFPPSITCLALILHSQSQCGPRQSLRAQNLYANPKSTSSHDLMHANPNKPKTSQPSSMTRLTLEFPVKLILIHYANKQYLGNSPQTVSSYSLLTSLVVLIQKYRKNLSSICFQPNEIAKKKRIFLQGTILLLFYWNTKYFFRGGKTFGVSEKGEPTGKNLIPSILNSISHRRDFRFFSSRTSLSPDPYSPLDLVKISGYSESRNKVLF